MNSKRTFYLMIALLVVLTTAIVGGAYLANQQLHKQSAKLLDYKTQDQVLTQEQTDLTKAKQDVAKYSQLEKTAKAIVPQDKDQALAIREIINIAAEAGIKPTSINFTASTLGAPSVGSASPSGVPTSPGSAKQSLSQLTPVKDIPGVYTLQLTIQQDATSPVPYPKFLDFLSRLEQNRRTAQVSGIVLQPSPLNHNLMSFTLTVDEYIKP